MINNKEACRSSEITNLPNSNNKIKLFKERQEILKVILFIIIVKIVNQLVSLKDDPVKANFIIANQMKRRAVSP